MATIEWHIGCSGFYYKEWKEIFYPKGLPANKWFSFYSEHFNTLESNVTFYRLPGVSTLNKWYEQSPADFNFSVKAPRLITHYKKLVNCETELNEFYNLVRTCLKDKTACILFQFPPSFSYTEERLNSIINSLDKSFNNIVEFRHESWWQQDVYQVLHNNHITFCNISHPALPVDFIATSPIFYLRLHGVPELYKSSYDDDYLESIIAFVKQHKQINTIYLYFNNTMNAAALNNAGYIKKLLSQLAK